MSILVKSETPSDEKNRWGTTWECFRRAQELFGSEFVIDVCAEPETSKCVLFIGRELFENPLGSIQLAVDSLDDDVDWMDGFWCNPPFNQKKEFIQKAIEQTKLGHSGMMLIPYEPCTKWFRKLVVPFATVIYVPDGRYNFLEIDGKTKKKGVNFPSCFVLWTPHHNGGEARIINVAR